MLPPELNELINKLAAELEKWNVQLIHEDLITGEKRLNGKGKLMELFLSESHQSGYLKAKIEIEEKIKKSDFLYTNQEQKLLHLIK